MSDVATFLARRLLADLDANGGQLERQPDQGDGLPRAPRTARAAGPFSPTRKPILPSGAP